MPGAGAAWLSVVALTVAGLALLASATQAQAPRHGTWLAAAFGFAAGLAGTPAPDAPSALPPSGLVRLRGRVEDVRYAAPNVARSRVVVSEGKRISDGAPVPRGTRVWISPTPLPEGAEIQLVATLSPQVGFRNPSPRAELEPTHAVRAWARLPSQDAARVVSHAWHARLLDAARRTVRARLHATLPPTAAGVACAMILGDNDAVAAEDRDDVRSAGLSHVFAVSGMHVTLLAGSCVLGLGWWLACVYPIAARFDPRRIAAAVGVPLALGIAVATGGSPSGYRAGLTSALAWSLYACGRRPDAPSVTAAACLAFAAWAPDRALQPAFLLSAAATAAIVSLPRASDSLPFPHVRDAFALTLRTSLATLPIQLWTFGSVAPLGVLANLALVPLGSCVLVLSALHALLACLCPLASHATAALLTLGARAFLAGSSAFAEATPPLSLPIPDTWQGVTLACATALVLLANSLRARVVTLLVAVLLLGLLELRLRSAEQPIDVLRATFLDVGQGDAALLDLPDGSSMLIDAGGNPQGGPDPGERVLVPLLRARRREAIELALLSHPHPDHYGGLRALLTALPIRELWDSGQADAEHERSTTSSTAHALLRDARARGTRVLAPARLCGAPRTYAGARIELLWPCPGFDAGFDPNDNSLVVRIRYGSHSLLFTGDIEAHAEVALLERTRRDLDLHADVLKVAHHGSGTSTSAAFLAAVSPKLAVVSAGATNHFGHPHPAVLQRLRARVPHVVDLGAQGGVVVETDGVRLRLDGKLLAQAPARAHTHPAARSCIP